ncbi:hypothetical protein BGZ51_001700 [Haplosporangium sp. Z 767]|nr:hypothetical protein BGZ51_001700 [Haplosporangium sp. Z 767]
MGRVLVVLPSDTDLSSNVVVPDTAITTTLGTNDTIDIQLPGAYSSNNATLFTEPQTLSRDQRGMSHPTGSDDSLRSPPPQLKPNQQSNVYRWQDRFDVSQQGRRQSSCSYGKGYDRFNRGRRHSHTGLIDMDYALHAFSHSRARSRQSMSHIMSNPHQSMRTPRTLKAAFRKARKDQSPLLTSASFGTDYMSLIPASELEDDDMLPALGADSSKSSTTAGSRHAGSYNCNTPPGMRNRSMEPMSRSLENDHVINTAYARTTRSSSVDFSRRSAVSPVRHAMDQIDSSDDIDLDGDEDEDLGYDSDLITSAVKPTPTSINPSRRQRSECAEFVDVDGVSDEEMNMPKVPTLTSSPLAQTRTAQLHPITSLNAQDQDIDLANTLDADMNMILGMASDMELVMPKFDDEYLEDLKNDPVLSGTNRGLTSASMGSPCYSQSSSTTTTSGSSWTSFTRNSNSWGSTPMEKGHRSGIATSRSPSTSTSRGHSSTPDASLSPRYPTHLPAQQDLSTIHKDIDNLKRHRDSLRRSSVYTSDESTSTASSHSIPPCYRPFESQPPAAVSSSSISPSVSATATSSDRKTSGPIYFKPSHHSLPDMPGLGEHPHQNVMIAQSNQWSFDNKAGPGPMVLPSHQQLGNTAMQVNERNHVFRGCETTPSPPSPPSLPLDKSAIMTTNNISLATANMNVLTPQEVQEDYYARRNLRLYQQRQRRRSSAVAAAAAAAAAASVNKTECQQSPLAARSSTAFGTHPLDKAPIMPHAVVPVPAIGASHIPASYYIPPSAFRTEAAVAAEREAERKRKEEEEELKNSFLVFPSPTLS